MKMSECLICLNPNPGKHLGVACCRACAAFYRRTKQLNLQYKCRLERSCDVTKKNRYSCRYCRYQKCLLKKLKLPESEEPSQSDYDASNPYLDEGISHSEKQEMLRSRLDELFRKCEPFRTYGHTISLSQTQQGLLALEEHRKHWPVPQPVKRKPSVDMNTYFGTFYQDMEYIGEFCASLREFVQLPTEDKWYLYKKFWMGFIQLERLHETFTQVGFDYEEDVYLLQSGFFVPIATGLSQMAELSNSYSADELKKLMDKTMDSFRFLVHRTFKRFKFDTFEVVYMMLNLLWDVKDVTRVSTETFATGARIKEQLNEELHNYYTFEKRTSNYADRLYRIVRMIAAVEQFEEIRKEDTKLIQTFGVYTDDLALTSFQV